MKTLDKWTVSVKKAGRGGYQFAILELSSLNSMSREANVANIHSGEVQKVISTQFYSEKHCLVGNK